jgi:hypothetical protein
MGGWCSFHSRLEDALVQRAVEQGPALANCAPHVTSDRYLASAVGQYLFLSLHEC